MTDDKLTPDFEIELQVPESTLERIAPEQPQLPIAQIDPLAKFPGVPETRIIEACGLLPRFVLADDAPIRANLEHCYAFGVHEITGGTIDPDGTHHYPEDPDLYPLMVIRKGAERMFIYEAAIVGILGDDGATFVTRLD